MPFVFSLFQNVKSASAQFFIRGEWAAIAAQLSVDVALFLSTPLKARLLHFVKNGLVLTLKSIPANLLKLVALKTGVLDRARPLIKFCCSLLPSR
jgi:hypothetical protein